MRAAMWRSVTQARKKKRGNIKEGKREQNECLCLSGWAEGLQSLAGVLRLTAAAASVLYLQVVPGLCTSLSISSSHVFNQKGP